MDRAWLKSYILYFLIYGNCQTHNILVLLPGPVQYGKHYLRKRLRRQYMYHKKITNRVRYQKKKTHFLHTKSGGGRIRDRPLITGRVAYKMGKLRVQNLLRPHPLKTG